MDVHLDIDAPRLEADEGVRDRAREHAPTPRAEGVTASSGVRADSRSASLREARSFS
jgi:hypothetical protein